MFIIMPTEKRLRELEVERAWRAKNREVLREKKRRYYLEHSENVKKRYAERKLNHNIMRAGVIKELYNGCCELCDESEICCLDFHHVDSHGGRPKGWGAPAFMIRLYEKWLLEGPDPNIAVLCRNCHTKVHRGIICYKNTLPPSSTILDFCE